MKRLISAFSVVALLMVASAALGTTSEWQSYRDEFSSVTYSGSNGSLVWKQSWLEVGEEDGPSTGAVHVDVDTRCADHKCLHIFGEGQLVTSLGAKRYAGVGQFEYAELCYEITRFVNEELTGQVDADLLVQISADGGVWTTVASYLLEVTDPEPIHGIHDIGDWLGDEVGIRFIVVGTIGGEVFIDNVEIKGQVVPNETTTTTKPKTTSTTKPKEATTTSRPATTTTERVTTTTETSTTTTRATTTTTDSHEDAIPVFATNVPPNSGLRSTESGVQVNYQSGLFGAMEMGRPEVLGVELTPHYEMAVEIVEASWVWMIGLALVIATAIVTGIDRRRMQGLLGRI